MRQVLPLVVLIGAVAAMATVNGQPASSSAFALKVALVKQPFTPTGTSVGPTTMAEGGIQAELKGIGADVRISQVALTPQQEPEYGAWKRLSYALGHLSRMVAVNTRDGYFTVGLLGTCPSMPGMVAGLQRSDPARAPLKIGMLWIDAHPDFNTPETTRSGSLGGMPVAIATGRCLVNMRQEAGLEPALLDEQVVMAGVRSVDPLEQGLLDKSKIQQVSVDDLRSQSPALIKQLERLSKNNDLIYVHIDMDVLDPREVAGHQNKVAGGPSSGELAVLLEMIFSKYPKTAAIGFATIPAQDEGGISLAALNRMIMGAMRGLQARGK